MNFIAVVGILLLYTYATAIAAPSPLRHETLDSNITLTLASSSTPNGPPPDPNIISIPLVGLVRCYSYEYTPWVDDIISVLTHAVTINHIHVVAGQGHSPVGQRQRYTMGHAVLTFDPSPTLTWLEWSLVLRFMVVNAQEYTIKTFLLLVSSGPTGVWDGSLTTI